MNNYLQKTSNPPLVSKDKGGQWYFFDLQGKILGRVVNEISKLLRGKNRPDFNYNFDFYNHVILVNSDKVILTGKKHLKKKYYDHSGYPGGLRERNAGVMIKDFSDELVRRVISGSMPHNRLSEKQLSRLFIYKGSDHPHKAQSANLVSFK